MVPCNIRCAFPVCDKVRFLCAVTFPWTLLYKFPFHSTYFSIRFSVRFVMPYPVRSGIRNPCVLRWLPSGFPPTLGLALTPSLKCVIICYTAWFLRILQHLLVCFSIKLPTPLYGWPPLGPHILDITIYYSLPWNGGRGFLGKLWYSRTTVMIVVPFKRTNLWFSC